MTTDEFTAKICGKSAMPGNGQAMQRVPLDRLRLPKPIPAGMDLVRVAAIADTLRTGGEVWDPAVVRRDGPDWVIVDGRHRWMASYMAGIPDLWCVEEA